MLELVREAQRDPGALKTLLVADELFVLYTDGLAGRNVATFVKEQIYEEIRTAEFEDCPQRIGGFFAWPDLDAAREFQELWRPGCYIHTCEIEGGWEEFDFNLVMRQRAFQPIEEHLQEVRVTAQRYWSGEEASPSLREILTNGKVTITGVLK